jgi:hypothetical protein
MSKFVLFKNMFLSLQSLKVKKLRKKRRINNLKIMNRRNIIIRNMWIERTGYKACSYEVSVYGGLAIMGL